MRTELGSSGRPTSHAGELLMAAMEQWKSSHNPAIESLRKAVAELGPILLQVVRGAQRGLRHVEEQVPRILKDSISSRGLIIPVTQISLTDLAKLVALHEHEGAAAVVDRIQDWYEEIFSAPDFLDSLERKWTEAQCLQRRLDVLRQALHAHRLSMYGVSIPTLVAQFEGLVVDLMLHEGRMSGHDLERHIVALTAQEPVTGAMLRSFVHDALWAQFFHGSPPPPFSRHAILHGGDTEYATEQNSRTAILLIDYVRELGEA